MISLPIIGENAKLDGSNSYEYDRSNVPVLYENITSPLEPLTILSLTILQCTNKLSTDLVILLNLTPVFVALVKIPTLNPSKSENACVFKSN